MKDGCEEAPLPRPTVAAEHDAGASERTSDNRELPAVLTVDEVALLLRVERKTVYEAIARGELPGVRRIGRLIRVSRAAVLEWLANGQVRVGRSTRR